MEVSENFAFLKQEFPHAAASASFAERHVFGDPRASCFHARHALEHLLKRVYKVEKTLTVSEFQSSELFSETALSSQPGCPETAFYGLGRRHEVPT